MDAHPLPVASATLDAGCAAVFRTLADGRRHPFAEFAPGAEARLAALALLGMPMRIDGDAVLATPFVPLDAASIATAIDGGATVRRRGPWRVRVAFELGSTNTDLLHDVKRHDDRDAPLVLAAELQHAGRGRLGRGWSSAPGASITASFALRIARTLAGLDGVTLVCGLAVQRVLAARGVAVRLKWPNDLLLDGRKLAGILVEVHAGAATTLVIGVGINVAFAAPRSGRPSALPPANLVGDGSEPIDRNRLIAELALALERHLARFESDGFGAFVEAWNAADAYADRAVRLESPPAPAVLGIARGVDDRGALLLEVGGARRRVIAGDVSLRPDRAAADAP